MSVGSSTGNNGTTSYTKSVAYGASVNLQAPATDPPGYTFSYWTLNGAAQTSGQKALTFTMTAAATAVARYTLDTCTLSVQSLPPIGVSIGSSTGHGGTTNYTKTGVAYGTSVNLQAPATNPAGYVFAHWMLNGAGQSSGQKAITFTMTAGTTAIAMYTPTFTLSVQSTPPAGLGIGSSTGQSGTTNYTKTGVASGTTVNLQAPAKDPADYVFWYWKLNGVAQAPAQKSKSLTFTMTAGTTAVAVYAPTYTLRVQSMPPTGVSVGSNTGNSGATDYTYSVASETSVNLQAPATDPAGYTFSHWRLKGAAQASGQKAITFTMTAATKAVARYKLNTFTLSVQSTPPTGLSIGSSTGHGGTTNYTKANVAYGTSVSLQAPATDPAGYTFSNWTLNGAVQTAGQKAITFTLTAGATVGGPVHGRRLIRLSVRAGRTAPPAPTPIQPAEPWKNCLTAGDLTHPGRNERRSSGSIM